MRNWRKTPEPCEEPVQEQKHEHEDNQDLLQEILSIQTAVLGVLHTLVKQFEGFQTQMSTQTEEINRLKGDVTTIESQGTAIITLVQGLAQLLRDNQADPQAISALADRLEAESNAIADAVAANTVPIVPPTPVTGGTDAPPPVEAPPVDVPPVEVPPVDVPPVDPNAAPPVA